MDKSFLQGFATPYLVAVCVNRIGKELSLHTVMGLVSLVGPLENTGLSDMKTGKIGRAGRIFIQAGLQHDIDAVQNNVHLFGEPR